MSGFGVVWFVWALLQVAVATYALQAVVRWRGERIAPAEGERWGVALLLPLVAAAVAAFFIVRVDDVEFARYLGSGALAVAAVALLAALLRRATRG
jgi:hypothetical protein